MATPIGLKAAGIAAWKRINDVSHIEGADHFAILEFCKNLDLINEFEKLIKKEGYLIKINNGATTITNPLLKEVNELKKMNLTLLKELGLTVNARVILGLGENKEIDFVTELLLKVQEFRRG